MILGSKNWPNQTSFRNPKIIVIVLILVILASVVYTLKIRSVNQKRVVYRDELIGENNRFQIFLVTGRLWKKDESSRLAIYDKTQKKKITTNASYIKMGTAVVFNDPSGEYLIISNGIYSVGAITPRVATIISVAKAARILSDFCHTGNPFFWQNFIIYDNCDTEFNRPWGKGEAPSVVAVNLRTGKQKVLFNSTPTSHFHTTKIQNNILVVDEIYIEEFDYWEKGKPMGKKKYIFLDKLDVTFKK